MEFKNLPPWLQKLGRIAKKVLLPYGLTRTQVYRILKATVATTIAFILILVDPVNDKIGASSNLFPVLTASMHPGRRLGSMIQSFYLGLMGLAIALPYSLFTQFLCHKVYESSGSLQNALGLLAFFEIIMLAIVGYVRSASPRLFLMVFLFFLVVHFAAIPFPNISYGSIAYGFSIPILMAMALCLIVNVVLFPEFGSTYIGTSVTTTLHEIQLCLNSATLFFTTADRKSSGTLPAELAKVMGQRKKVRGVLAQCQATMMECTYEMSWSYMGPQEIKPLTKILKKLSVSQSALIVACELEFAVFSSLNSESSQEEARFSIEKEEFAHSIAEPKEPEKPISLIDQVKPKKEVSYADKEILLRFLDTVRAPILTLLIAMSMSITDAKLSLARAYDVPMKKVPEATLPDDLDEVASQDSPTEPKPSTSSHDREITPETLEIQLSVLVKAINLFDVIIKDALSKVAGDDADTKYIMPRDEFFLLSSFLLNFRESALVVSNLLETSRCLLETRIRRESRGWRGMKLWVSFISTDKHWSKFFSSGNFEASEGHSANVVEIQSIIGQEITNDAIKKSQYSVPEQSTMSTSGRVLFKIRTVLADFLDALGKRKGHLKAMFQTVFLLMLLSFPMFSVSMHSWYVKLRGSWVGFIAMLAFETSVGATVYSLAARTILLVSGSAWGYVVVSAQI